jgi:transposase-like protein
MERQTLYTPRQHYDEAFGCDGKRSKYSKDDKFRAARAIQTEGTVQKAADLTGIPHRTIVDWRSNSWWSVIEKKVTEELNGTLDELMTASIHKAIAELQDRLDNGDKRRQASGKIVRVPLPAKELAAIASLLFDKRAALRGEGLSIGNAAIVDFSKLKSQFQNFAKEIKAEKVVSEQ